jgi:glycosyltransferase involved in cell wall biosynthesis
MKKVLFIGDGVTYTGFSTVLHNIIKRIPQNLYDVHHLAINYFGDPHEYSWKIYPAYIGGDIYGIKRLPSFNLESFAGIFILNDPIIVNQYLAVIKKLNLKRIPPIIVYTPIDGYDNPKRYFSEFDIVSQLCVYTKFAQEELKKINIDSMVVPHGVDRSVFYKLFNNRVHAKKLLFSSVPDLANDESFVVLNANRNQPRKRIDLTLLGFKLFAEKTPKNVKLYLHCGKKDAGWFIPDIVANLGLEDRVIMTESDKTLPQIPTEAMNLLYNACDVGINTSTGEGWGLVNVEHAVTGAPQIVPNHTSTKEIFEDTGLLIDVATWIFTTDVGHRHAMINPEDLANKLLELYQNRTLYNQLAEKSIEKFSQPQYDWDFIVKEQFLPLFERLWT